jgi:hypothetical protein
MFIVPRFLRCHPEEASPTKDLDGPVSAVGPGALDGPQTLRWRYRRMCFQPQ